MNIFKKKAKGRVLEEKSGWLDLNTLLYFILA